MPNLCTITGILYDQFGNVAANKRLQVTPLSVTGLLMSSSFSYIRTNASGEVKIQSGTTLVPWVEVQGTTIQIEGGVLGYDTPVNVLIPSTSTANFLDLTSVATVSTSGLTIYNEAVVLPGLYGAIDFAGAGVDATQASSGRLLVTVAGGAGLPVVDTQTIIKGSADATKLLRFEVDGFTTGTTRVATFPNKDGTVAFLDDLTAGSGTVTSFSAGDLSPLFTTSEANPTTTPALSFTLTNQNANLVYAGPGTGGAAAPSFRSLVAGDIPALAYEPTSSFTAFGRSLVDDADATAGRSTLGLGTLATQNGTFSGTSSGTNTGDQTSVTGNAGTATALATARAINGVNFDGTAAITVTAAAGTLSGTTLASGVTASSLTSFGASIALGTPGSGVLTSCTGLPLSTGVTGDLPFANFVQASAASKLVGRGSASGAGDYEEITVGSGLTMTGTTLSAAGGSGATTALDNLAAVAINTSLLPGGASVNLGSATLPFLSSFTGNTTQREEVTQSAGVITHTAAGSATNIGFDFATKGSGSVRLGFTNATAGATAPVLFGAGGQAWSSTTVAAGIGTTGTASAHFYITAGGTTPFDFANSTTQSTLVFLGDAGIGRISAGLLGIGTGALGSFAGSLKAASYIVGGTSGELFTVQTASELLTLSTSGLTTDTTANLLPAGAIILSVTCRVTTTITTTTNWAVGDPTTATRFSAANATLTSGTTSVGLNHLQGSVATDAAGPVQTAAAKVRITCTGSNPGAGVVRITVAYLLIGAPTS